MRIVEFLNNLYIVSAICKESEVPYAVIRFNPRHDLYKAHFPGHPITPGVILLQIATIMLEHIEDKQLQLQEVENIKFNKTVGSNDTINIVYNKVEEINNQLKASIQIEIRGTVYAKMLLTYNIIRRP